MNEIDELEASAERDIKRASSTPDLAAVETRYLGSKGQLQVLLRRIGSLPKEQRPTYGARLNQAKERITHLIADRRREMEYAEVQRRLEAERLDVTLPGRPLPIGRLHPLTQTMNQVVEVLSGLGFQFVEGPELEDYTYNFQALNYPEDHPAFDEMMTFYVDDQRLLRTQTTALQGRVMQRRKPPFRIATTGRCFRYEAVDATHHHTFHQVDVFMVDEGISMADLKGTLRQFAGAMFGGDVKVRFRPDFFPFVEPGVDYAIFWHDHWLELGGAGLIHPNILERFGMDSERWTGFAFGLGIERIHMIQHGVNDLRLYLENDLRFLSQF
ncbi:MAG: phenylalanine--tRNA ligase subunit alpha [Chthonomonadales bacterium]